MTEAQKSLARIESLLADIEQLDAASGGQFRQAQDREAHDIAARIERRMRRKNHWQQIGDVAQRVVDKTKT